MGSASCPVQSALLFPSLVVVLRTAFHAFVRTVPTPEFAGGPDAHLSFSSNSTPIVLIKSLCQFLPYLGFSHPQRVSQLARYDARRSRREWTEDGEREVMPELHVCPSSSRTWATEKVPPRYCFGLVGLIVSAVTAHFELLGACIHRMTEGRTSARVLLFAHVRQELTRMAALRWRRSRSVLWDRRGALLVWRFAESACFLGDPSQPYVSNRPQEPWTSWRAKVLQTSPR